LFHSEFESRGGLQQQRSERFYFREEKRGCMGANRGTQKPETGCLMSQAGNRVFIAFVFVAQGQKSLWCKQKFPGKEKCFPG
jgi:hypothetical protein